MSTMLMSGFDRKHVPTRSLREAARGSDDPMAQFVSTGNLQPWDLFTLRASSGLPGASDWADKTLDSIVASAMDRFQGTLECEDCTDLGYYGQVSRENPDVLTSLLRRVGDGGYEQLTASGTWTAYEIVADQQLEILDRDLAGDLADAITAGASGLARRYFWPVAFLPPGPMIAAAPAKELTTDPAKPDAAAVQADDATAANAGWTEYAVVDDLDPGAVIDLIRLRRGPAGPELVAYRGGAWAEAPDLLTDLQGVQPPPLVQLTPDQLTNVMAQIDAGTPSSGADDGDGPDDETDPADAEDDAKGAESIAAAMALMAGGPPQAERDKLAKEGKALPDGGFPIKNHDDLGKAVKALGRATNKHAAKRHIIKRARELNGIHKLPEDWGVTAASGRMTHTGHMTKDQRDQRDKHFPKMPKMIRADGLPETQKCAYGPEQATQRVIHSEGMAYIPACDKHLDLAKNDAAKVTPDGVYDPSNVDGVQPISAAFMPNRNPAGSPTGGQFAAQTPEEERASKAKAVHDQQQQQKEDDRQRKISEHEQDRNRKISEHEQDRTRKQQQAAEDRKLKLANAAQDRALKLAAHTQAQAAKKKAKASAKKGSKAHKANYGSGGVAGYNAKTGTISYKDGSSYNGSSWKTADGSRITASGGLLTLVADAPLTVSPDPRAEKLRRYWTAGKGALKIRWGTPGDWKRCYRQLTKYMGLRAKGYCQNLHKRATGVWTGSRLNPGGHRGRTAAIAASGTSGALSMEAALVAAVSTGRWFCPEGGTNMLKDGVYTEGGDNVALLRTLTAGGFPVSPPDDWFENPQLDEPTPLTVDDDGRVYGHIATRDVAHIGLPGRVKAPVSKSNYAYFKTGQLVTASGKKVNVGQLTLAGGHAPLNADASAAVAHYDNTASAVVDVNCGDDKFGIWVAGALRPEVTPSQLRTLRASAPSGDWRPINGNLELVACCQVNVPGFPVVRARVASGAITSLVAAGAGPLYARRLALMADASMAERLAAVESVLYNGMVADGEEAALEGLDAEPLSDAEAAEEGLVTPEEEAPEEKPVSDAVKRAREAVAARKAAESAETPAAETAETTTEEPAAEDQEKIRADRLAALRERVHGSAKEPVAASA